MRQWIINKVQGGHHVIKRDEGHLPMVADVYGTDEEAQLIAAAPELLAAANQLIEGLVDREVVEGLPSGTLVSVPIDDICALCEAITQTKGGE